MELLSHNPSRGWKNLLIKYISLLRRSIYSQVVHLPMATKAQNPARRSPCGPLSLNRIVKLFLVVIFFSLNKWNFYHGSRPLFFPPHSFVRFIPINEVLKLWPHFKQIWFSSSAHIRTLLTLPNVLLEESSVSNHTWMFHCFRGVCLWAYQPDSSPASTGLDLSSVFGPTARSGLISSWTNLCLRPWTQPNRCIW